MRVFLAGATGAIGARLVPLLVNAGHTVTGTTRDPAKADRIRAAGASPVVVDALRSGDLLAAVQQAEPEVIIHQLTAIPSQIDLKHWDRTFAATNRLRIAATDTLVTAARAVGSRRVIAQSYAGWPYARTGSWVKTETDPLISAAEPESRETLQAILHLESAVLGQRGIEGVVLRYGSFYGPGTSLGPDGSFPEDIRRRRVPIVGRGTGYWSFLHIDDAAAATLAAVEGGEPGVYNVTDDEPAPVSEWLPFLAQTLGAPPPRRIPAWLAKFAIGSYGVAMMTEIRGASNLKAKTVLGWKLRWPTWRQGFRRGMDAPIPSVRKKEESRR
jgi:nucleoside-diphosphate-sugar epimerase